MALLLGSEKVTVDFPAKTVLDEVTIGIMEGDRIGIGASTFEVRDGWLVSV